MKLSKYFCPILKEKPKDAVVVSHILMIQAGLIRQTSSGIYAWLPMGLKVLENIQNIINKELEKSGAIKMLMPTIQSADIWEESGRYEDYGLEMLRIKDRHDRDMLYGPTNEEMITKLFSDNVKSYKDLPLNLYHIQWKFRDEIRPRFGVMRGREFLMKDAYSFDLTEKEAELSYKKMFAAYLKIFNQLGLKSIPMQADTGPIGGDLSHEFMILAKTGESEVFCDKEILELKLDNQEINYDQDVEDIFNQYTSYYSATDEKHSEDNPQYIKNKDKVVTARGIEVGHIFYFADKYSKAMNTKITNKEGKEQYPLMGSYGIGVSRLLAAIIEASHDENGIIWPVSVAPYMLIINALGKDEQVAKKAEDLYKYLLKCNIEVILNDTNDSVGAKLKNADLMGIPFQINIGNKSLSNNSLELKERKTGNIKNISFENIGEVLIEISKHIEA